MNRTLIIQIIFLIIPTLSCKSRDKSESELYLSKAQGLPQSDSFSSIVGSLYSASGEDFCTAALINSCNLITATHCAQNLFLEGFRTNRGVKVEIENDMFSVVPADNLNQSPSAQATRLTDISIIRLKHELSPEFQIEIPQSTTLQPGDQLTLFGASTMSRLSGGPDVQKGIGIFENYKMKEGNEYRKDALDQSTVDLDKMQTASLVLRGSDNPSKGSMICGGDSGGPTFDKANKLVGIHQGSASVEMVFLCYFDKKFSRKPNDSRPKRSASPCNPDKQIETEQFSTNAVTITGCVDRRTTVKAEDQDKIWSLEKHLSFCRYNGNLASFEDLKRIAADADFRSALVPGQKNGTGVFMVVAEKRPQGHVVFNAASSLTGEVFSGVDDQFFCNQTIQSYDSSVVHYRNGINKILESTKHRCSQKKTGLK